MNSDPAGKEGHSDPTVVAGNSDPTVVAGYPDPTVVAGNWMFRSGGTLGVTTGGSPRVILDGSIMERTGGFPELRSVRSVGIGVLELGNNRVLAVRASRDTRPETGRSHQAEANRAGPAGTV